MLVRTEAEVDIDDILVQIPTQELRDELLRRDEYDDAGVRLKNALYDYLRDQPNLPRNVREYIWLTMGRVL